MAAALLTDAGQLRAYLARRWSPGTDFRIEELNNGGQPLASSQQLTGWLRVLRREGLVEYVDNEREWRGTRYGARADYYPVRPYWIWRGR